MGRSDTGLPEPAREDARTLRATRRARLALARWGLKIGRLTPLSVGFKEVFSVETRSGERFVLRMYGPPPGDGCGDGDPRYGIGAGLRRPETILAQLEWLRDLKRETGLAVPEPVAALDGSYLVSLSAAEISPLWRHRLSRWESGRRGGPVRNCVLLRWLPGTRKERLTPQDLSRVGAYVAGLHGYAIGRPVPQEEYLPRWDWGWPFGESAPIWERGESFYAAGEMDVFREAARRAREDLDRLGKGQGTFGVIHRDLKFGNLLFDGPAVGALDFDLLGHGYYIFDLRVLRFSLGFHITNPQPLWNAFMEAYGSGVPLPEDHERFFPTFAVMQRVASVNRQLDLLGSDDTARRPPRHLKDVVAWLKRFYLEQGG